MKDRLVGYFAVGAAVCWLGLFACTARAQTPPFFGGGVVAYDPVPATVFSGALLDAQPVVSDDRRYVTLNMRATNSRLRELVRFPVAQTTATPQGFVGGAVFPSENPPTNPPAPTGGGNSRATPPASPRNVPSPVLIDRAGKSWILARQGMYLIAPLP